MKGSSFEGRRLNFEVRVRRSKFKGRSSSLEFDLLSPNFRKKKESAKTKTQKNRKEQKTEEKTRWEEGDVCGRGENSKFKLRCSKFELQSSKIEVRSWKFEGGSSKYKGSSLNFGYPSSQFVHNLAKRGGELGKVDAQSAEGWVPRRVPRRLEAPTPKSGSRGLGLWRFWPLPKGGRPNISRFFPSSAKKSMFFRLSGVFLMEFGWLWLFGRAGAINWALWPSFLDNLSVSDHEK